MGIHVRHDGSCQHDEHAAPESAGHEAAALHPPPHRRHAWLTHARRMLARGGDSLAAKCTAVLPSRTLSVAAASFGLSSSAWHSEQFVQCSRIGTHRMLWVRLRCRQPAFGRWQAQKGVMSRKYASVIPEVLPGCRSMKPCTKLLDDYTQHEVTWRLSAGETAPYPCNALSSELHAFQRRAAGGSIHVPTQLVTAVERTPSFQASEALMMPARTRQRRDASEARHVYCSEDVCTCRWGHPNRWTDCSSDSASIVTSGWGAKAAPARPLFAAPSAIGTTL